MLPIPIGTSNQGILGSEFALGTILYFLVALGFVFPPPEFYGFGLTIETLFKSIIGDEALHFTEYHIRLTTVRLLTHTCIMPVYYTISSLFANAWHFNIWHFILCSTPLLLSLLVTFYWYCFGSWNNHPLARTLAGHTSDSQGWLTVSDALAAEFRRVDKFVHGKTWGKVVVTDNWIVRCGLYVVSAAYQPDVHMSIQATEEYQDPESRHTTQFISIRVASINTACNDFFIRLNSTDYSDLSNKVSGPILNVRSIVFHQTVTEKFEEAFRDEVSHNGLYLTDRPRDECIGCLHAVSDVKLSKLCDDVSVGECKHCLCRPMWCLQCMAKWFANRQDKNAPERWMAGKAPCPTCRSVFCMRDIQMIA